MSNIKISADKLGETIRGILDEFAQATYADIKEAVDKTAKDTAKNTRSASPVRTGKYKRGWARKTTRDTSDNYAATVYNKAKPRLTHLLQNGHGGPRPAPAHPHIQQDDETARIFEENLRKEMNS